MVRANLCNLAGEPQLMSAESEIVARGQHHVSVLGEVCDKRCHTSECIVRELMSVVDYYDDRIVVLVQLRKDALDHVGAAKGWRWNGRLHRPERRKQHEPEPLFVVLAPRRNKDQAIRILHTPYPGAQQRCLTATRGRRDQRDALF